MSIFFFFFNDTATTEIYTLSLHDALPIYQRSARLCVADYVVGGCAAGDRHLLPDDARSEEHTSELQSQSNLVCRLLLEKKKQKKYMKALKANYDNLPLLDCPYLYISNY